MSQATEQIARQFANGANNARTWGDIIYNVKVYGAKGDGINNDAPAFQKAVDAMPIGGVLRIPPGDYLFNGGGAQLLLIDKPIILVGSGYSSKIIVGSSVPSTTDVIRVSPPINSVDTMSYIGDFCIWSVSGTQTYGRHAIHLDVSDPNQHIRSMMIARLNINGVGGNAIKLTNPTGIDGFFFSTIQDCLMNGGLNLERAGDSNNILRNTLYGTKTGITLSTVVGAAMTVIEANNITTTNGAISITGGNQIKIRNNQIEQIGIYDGDKDASVYLGDCELCEVIGNNLHAHGKVGFNVRIGGNSNSNKVSDNVMNEPIAAHVWNQFTSVRTVIGKYGRFFDVNGVETEYPDVENQGAKTEGVMVPITLSAGVTDYNATTFWTASVKKSESGRVELYGQLNVTTITSGTVIANIPEGFRPALKARYINVVTVSGATVGAGILSTDGSGDLVIQSVLAGTTRIVLDGTFYTSE